MTGHHTSSYSLRRLGWEAVVRTWGACNGESLEGLEPQSDPKRLSLGGAGYQNREEDKHGRNKQTTLDSLLFSTSATESLGKHPFGFQCESPRAPAAMLPRVLLSGQLQCLSNTHSANTLPARPNGQTLCVFYHGFPMIYNRADHHNQFRRLAEMPNPSS